MNTFNEHKAEKLLERILRSSEFASSPTYQKLLRYLFEKSQQGDKPSESTIAIEFFEKKGDFNPAKDSTVRSQVHALRKKLHAYYLTEGKHEKVKLEIPKGRYELYFHQVQTETSSNLYKRTTIILSCLLFLALAALALVLSLPNSTLNTQKSKFGDSLNLWSDFIDSPLPVLIIVGDYYFFDGGETYYGSSIKTRYGSINSDNDLEQFLKRFPNFDYEPASFRYTSNQLISGLSILLQNFYQHNKKVNITFSSHMDSSLIARHNVIFMGPSKTLGSMERYLHKLNIDYQHYPHRLYAEENEKPSSYERVQITGRYSYRTGYSIVTKQPGEHDNLIMIIAAFSPGSVLRTINYIHSPHFFADVKSTILNKMPFPRHFAMLFENTHIHNNDFIACKEIFPIDSNDSTANNLSVKDVPKSDWPEPEE